MAARGTIGSAWPGMTPFVEAARIFVPTGVTVLFALSCLGNTYPVAIFPVGVLALLFSWRLLTGARLGWLPKLMLWIMAYSLFSAWLSGISSADFFRYEFWRHDGKFVFAYIPFLAACTFSHSKRQLRIVEKIWVLGAAIPAALAVLVQFVPGLEVGGFADFELVRRSPSGVDVFHGLFFAHTATGSFYALALIFGSNFMHLSRHRLVYVGAVVAIACGLILSLSRAFAVATLLALVVQSVFQRRVKFLIALGVIAVVLVTGIGGTLLDRIFVRGEDPSAEANTQARFLLWARAVDYFLTSPIIGVGFSRYDDYPDTFRGTEGFLALKTSGSLQVVDGEEEWSMQAHNNYLQILAELGIVGLVLWLLFWGGAIRRLHRVHRASAPGSLAKAWSASCLTASLAVLLASLFDLNFWAPAVILPLGWAIGAALSPYGPFRLANSPQRVGPGTGGLAG